MSDTRPVFSTILHCCERLIPSVDYVQIQAVDEHGMLQLVDATLAESGLPEFDIPFWNGIFAPAGTPKAIIDRLATEGMRFTDAHAPDAVCTPPTVT